MTQSPNEAAGGSDAKDSAPKGDDAPTERKERVLHTRVPAVLEQELKRFADNLRIPVSNLVRTILEDALHAADVASDVVEERLRTTARRLEHERIKLKKKVLPDPVPLEHVYAFQEIRLAKRGACARCDKLLEAGERAHLGLTDRPGAPGERIFVCDACVPPNGASA